MKRSRSAPSPRSGRGLPHTNRQAKSLADLFQMALGRHQAGDFASAERAYRKILSIDAAHAMVWSNLAAVLIEQTRYDESIAACTEALRLLPNHLNALLNLATAQQKTGEHGAAAGTFATILDGHPQRSDIRKSMGLALESAGRGVEALSVYDAMIAADPNDTGAWTAKAEVLKKAGDIEAAIACFAEVVKRDPNDASALSSMGILKALQSIDNDLNEAADLCLRASMLAPENAAILNNLGVVLHIRGETDNALLLLRQLTVQSPRFAPAYSNIGSILSALNRYDEAQVALSKALEIDPKAQEAQIELTKVRRHLCDWRFAEEDACTIRTQAGNGTNFMIVLMTVCNSAAEQLAYARLAMAKYNRRADRLATSRKAKAGGKLKIGYISADFRDHPVGRLVPDLITLHDRSRFEIMGYSIGPDDAAPLRARLAAAFDRFVDLHKVSDLEAATRIAQDEIDILVDLTGPTANSRFDILALRPAPVQVSFLGLPGTAGADCVDYIIADPFLVPSGAERFYHERVVRLPHCYQPGDTARQVLTPLPSRSDCGLPERGFVFCSFNSPVKITPEVFDVWMRLLKAVEDSVLWLYCKAETTRDNLFARAQAAGVDPDRIIFAGPGQYEIHLTRMTCADLFLDTFPYAAGATCNDALWVGLPVLTCVGETYVSRMAGSLLNTLGMSELITETLDDYERVARDLAMHPEKMRSIRDRLWTRRQESPLFDMTKFTITLESAYVRMASIGAAGGVPTAFDVPAA